MPEAPKAAWKPRDPLPPWDGENDAMRDWMFHQLENFYRDHAAELAKEPIDPEAGDTTILELLDSGDDREHARGLAQLRQLNVPLLGPDADRISWKRKRGHPKSPLYDSSSDPNKYYDYRSRVRMAKLALPIIRKKWREHYGKWHRSRGDIDAYEIAADYFLVDVEAVRAKASGRHKPRAKDKRP